MYYVDVKNDSFHSLQSEVRFYTVSHNAK